MGDLTLVSSFTTSVGGENSTHKISSGKTVQSYLMLNRAVTQSGGLGSLFWVLRIQKRQSNSARFKHF